MTTGAAVEVGRWWDISRAPEAIYGTIISASVLAAAHSDDAVMVALGVFITLLVYWLAERWSELIAGHLSGEPFSRAYVRKVFVHGWPMVQASYAPMLVLIIADLFGASTETAINIALAVTIVLLAGLGSLVGAKAKLPPWGVAFSSGFVAFLGVLLIVLKTLLH
jgi:hypothetical protein